ncbi:hypothetical protein [Microbacterium halophytorum]|uniref:hypothetical protein n=1 Tax=Microbacterium halophytorum TaxID=2067568 RepID=UPI000CFC65D5|nr:hypothetical protein [Microbacterium halophytorum]
MDKFELTTSAHPEFPALRRIRALTDVPEAGVRAGDLGGYVASADNLSQVGASWVFDDALVFDAARVSENAQTRGRAWVFGCARITDTAVVEDRAWVFGNAHVLESARVSEQAAVWGSARLSGTAWARGSSDIGARARISDERELLAVALWGAARPVWATLVRTGTGHEIRFDRWRGSIADFRARVAEANSLAGRVRPQWSQCDELLAFADMCAARTATWSRGNEGTGSGGTRMRGTEWLV